VKARVPRIDPRTSVGPVALTVRDLERMRAFYERVLGLQVLDGAGQSALLGVPDRPLVILVEDRAAPPRPPRSTGLFHLAILVPDRAELARALQRTIEARWPLQGASDHLVSEALYLGDPEGNGIEIYRDRPTSEWLRDGDEIRMATLPLDLDEVLAELDGGRGPLGPLPGSTRMGHVHLNVADLALGEAFYAGLLGLDVTARGYPGALFLSAGGYHHHVGLNTWRGPGAPSPPPGALGLEHYDLVVPDAAALEDIVERLREGDAQVTSADDGFATRDPSGNTLRLVVAD
jgi:catechol 2,3-dioxygenase